MQIVLTDRRCLHVPLEEIAGVINDDSKMEIEVLLKNGQSFIAKNDRLETILLAFHLR